jgi:hypothetical protein
LADLDGWSCFNVAIRTLMVDYGKATLVPAKLDLVRFVIATTPQLCAG